MNKFKEQELISQCLLQIEEILGWGKSVDWHNDVFYELSEAIQERTNVLLSTTTLKRVWGKVSYNNSPSISTLNTLSQFAGYNNWRDFKNHHENFNIREEKKKNTTNLPTILAIASAIALIFISLFSVIKANKSEYSITDISKIKFSSKPVTVGMPNSVVFNIDMASIESDSIYIQQYWDPTKTIKINSDQKQATGIYYFPGYFRAKLVVDGNVIKEHDLFIKSDGWSGSIDYNPVPKYLKTQLLINNGLSLPNSIIDEIKSNKLPLTSTYHLVDDLGSISGDNFTLETTIKNVYNDKWAVCQTAKIYLLGSKGAFIIPFTISGCISNINVMLNDVYLNGKEHDLSSLGVDLSTFKDIKISVENKKLKVFVNQEEMFSASYNETMGKLVGIRFKFLGAGEVKQIKVLNASGKTVIKDDFTSL